MSKKLTERECVHCGQRLTVSEVAWYGWGCESCERITSERLTSWKNGEHVDLELEKIFALPLGYLH